MWRSEQALPPLPPSEEKETRLRVNFGFIRGPVLYGFFFLQSRLRRHAVAEHAEEAHGFEGTVGGMAAAEGIDLEAEAAVEADFLKATPHNSAARRAMSFPASAARKFRRVTGGKSRNFRLHLTKNPFAGRPPHLCGVALHAWIACGSG